MKEKKVKEIMIPLSDYASVDQNTTIFEAILELEKSQEKIHGKMQPYRAVLVLDDNKKIVGKIGHLTFLKAMEPNYDKIKMDSKLRRANLNADFINSLMDNFKVWEENFFDICNRAKNVQVKDVMKPVEEHIDEAATLVEAMHKMIMWQTLSVLVSSGMEIVGIIRLSDLYEELAAYIKKSCANSDPGVK